METINVEKLNKRDIQDIIMLTPVQEGMLFHYLKEPGSDYYFEQLCLDISGYPDIDIFEKAWDFVVQGNEMLRTVFRWEKIKNPSQLILTKNKHKLKIRYENLNRDKIEIEKWLEEIKAGDRDEGFDLRGVPFRVTLCRVSEKRHVMIISHHHILYDGWSTGIILKEFFAAYGDFSSGRSPVEPVKSSFKDFARYMRGRDSDSEAGREQERFWRGYLDGFASRSEVTVKARTGRWEPDGQEGGSRGDTAGDIRIQFPVDFKNKLERWVQSRKLTVAAVFYTAWGILLQRYNNSTDVVFGTTVSGRSANAGIKGIEDIVGLFINTIPLRINIDQGQCGGYIAELPGRVNRMLQAREAHENTSLVKIREYSQLDNKEELFDSIVTIENYPLDQRIAESGGPLTVDSYAVIERTHYDLTVNITVFNAVDVQFSYDTRLFAGESILRLSHHFGNILTAIIEDPGCPLSSLEMISPQEKRQILFGFNSAGVEYPVNKTIHGLFAEQAEKGPDIIAVVGRGRVTGGRVCHLSYGELDKTSGRLAWTLRQKGVGPGTIGAIMVERSLEMMVGIFAILKAGGAYLPIDPAYPGERIDYILKDSNAVLLLTADELSHIGRESATRGPQSVPAASPAYVIYTSGSTGYPKGVVIEHRSVINRLKWMQERYPLGAGDLILQKTPYTFDVSVWELFWWSFEGAGVCLLKAGGEREPDAMVEAIETHGVTVMHFVPSMLQVMLEYVEKGGVVSRLKCLRRVFASGEKLEIDHVKRFNRLFARAGTKLINLYGPTEATVDVSYFDCWGREDWEIIPIGKPIDNIHLYIFDRAGHLTPIGVPGELNIHGIGVARGYLNRPELTAERFVDYRSYRTYRTYRFYKTGDLARWLADGNIEFLGRIDHQVKIRGFRVETGEIESHLLKHEAVNDAIVLFKEDAGGNQSLWGYIVSREDVGAAELKEFLLRDLPDYMVPAYFIRLERIPLTGNGKVDRGALGALGHEHELASGAEYAAPSDDVEKKLVEIWSEVLAKDKDLIGIHDNFFDIGGNSLHIIRVNSRLKDVFQRDIPIVAMFNYPTITLLGRYLSREPGAAEEGVSTVERTWTPGTYDAAAFAIAVIGMAGRFPGAGNIDEFRENLWNGAESITFFTREQFLEAGGDPGLVDDAGYVKAKGVLEADDYFDAVFFGYTPREASVMDPQMRLFHECTWEALENAGYDPGSYNGLIGLYAGATQNPYWGMLPIVTKGPGDSFSSQWETVQYSDKDYLCTRVSYKLNLKGPALTIQTACSTSLAAIDLACSQLLWGRCDMALAGGVSVTFQDRTGYPYQEGMIMSPDGHCRAFDAGAGGTVGGNGVGIVVLKPLAAAVRDRDFIHAVIKGSAANNDGTRKVGFTAPSVEGQVEVVRAAQRAAGVEPHSIGYIEAHGTGTPLGDPIEIEALKQVFHTSKRRFCAVGSVKTNVGHLDAAAGAAGFIKAVLAVKHGVIPPSLNFSEPNPAIDFENSPFYVNTVLKEWPTAGTPRRAGVSSFGIGGTNAHVILEEAPVMGEREENGREDQLILLSARTEFALDTMAQNLVDYLRKNPGVNLADIAYTLQVGRQAFARRSAMVCSTRQEAVETLSSPGTGKIQRYDLKEQKENPGVIFMFPGQGAQYVNMGLGIYRSESVFREELDCCFDILEPLMGDDIKGILYPGEMQNRSYRSYRSNRSNKSYDPDINRTGITQPVIFAFEYALARLLMAWGIRPDAMIGHSIGEYVAACLSGVFSLEDALNLVVLRGKLMQGLPAGSMLSIPLAEEELKPLLTEFNAGFLPGAPLLSLAAVNSFSRCTVSGRDESIRAFARHLEAKGYQSRQLHTSHAFHSDMMDPILEEFAEKAKGAALHRPSIPYISNISGGWITAEETTDPGYWAKHMRAAVRFADGIAQLLKKGNPVFLEVGPGKTLSTFVRDHGELSAGHRVINLVRHPREQADDGRYLLGKIGTLWLYGKNLDWRRFHSGGDRYRVPLPAYPFERQRYPAPPGLLTSYRETPVETPIPGKNPDISQWFYVPVWKQSRLTASQRGVSGERGTWLVFMDDTGVGTQLVNRLTTGGDNVFTIKAGHEFIKEADGVYRVNPGTAGDYDTLLADMNIPDTASVNVVHLWGVTGPEAAAGEGQELERVDRELDRGFFSLLHLVRALGAHGAGEKISLAVVTDHMQEVIGGDMVFPEKAAVLGPVKVIPLEYPHIDCRSIDIVCAPLFGGIQQEQLPGRLMEELTAGGGDRVIAYRGNYRWVQTFEPAVLAKPGTGAGRLKKKGVYLVTGGFGGIGFVLARHLAETLQARLILTGRGTPSLEEQEQVRELENLGAEVLVCSADVSHPHRVEEVLRRSLERFGAIHGIIHAAGIADYAGVIAGRSREQSGAVLAPKVKGTLVLDEQLTRMQIEPDFFVLCSSMSSVIAPVGQVAYASANAFLDAFAYQRQGNSQRHTFFISINWDTWQTVGMAEEAAKKFSGKSGGVDARSFLQHGILPGEGIDVFNRLLEERLPQVAVSTRGLSSAPTSLPFAAADSPAPAGFRRPVTTTPYAPPGNEIEKQLAEIFQAFLGFEKVGINDDFFELGGDSLKAMTILSHIRKSMDREIPLAEFFNKPFIKGLAGYMIGDVSEAVEKYPEFLEPVEEKEYYGLSSAQRRLYVLQRMETRGTVYNMPSILDLEGTVDRDRFRDIFSRLIQRHESLRTSFEIVNGEPVQRIHRLVEFEIENISVEQFVRPFELSRAPLFRVGLIKGDEARHILMVDMPHIIADGISELIVIDEFLTLYRGGSVPGLRLRYKDFSEWRNRKRTGQILAAREAFWLKELSGEVPVLGLPLDYNRPAVQSFDGRTLGFALEAMETGALNELAAQRGVTLYMVLLSIYNILLSRLSGQEDIIVGTPVGGRGHADLEPIIGMFVNTLVLRNYPRGEITFSDFLGQVRERTLAAFENRDYPFEDLVDRVVADRDLSRNPLFDVMFMYQERVVVETRDNRAVRREYETGASKFDMTLMAVDAGDKLILKIEYCTALFNESAVERFTGYFKNIVNAVIADPGVRLWAIEMVPETEKERVLYSFNRTAAEYPAGRTIHELFEEQVERTPDSAAVVGHGCMNAWLHEEVLITYRDLNQRSGRLAHVLREKGVGANTVVGIMLDRSMEMVIGIMGILKAGGAYLPIDPAYPEERKQYMLADSGAGILLTNLSAGHHLHHSSNQFIAHHSTNIAYVIYTSGSTGKPKGVMVEHGAILNTLFALFHLYPFSGTDVYLLKTSYIFDVSVSELFGWFFGGGRLAVLEKEGEKDPVKIRGAVSRYEVTHLNFVPSMFAAFVEQLDSRCANDLSSLKYIFLAGEALLPEPVVKFTTLVPHVILENIYGPTEASIYASKYSLREWTEGNRIPIGVPLPNVKLYILDSYRCVQPIGVAGELFICGAGLARGYLNRPELTAERFVDYRSYRSYWSYRTYRSYKTGDLSRWLADGNIEFLGRMDYQVKIRGFRVEPGEIENRLLEIDGINEAVVVERAHKGDNYLCAYIVSDTVGGAKENWAELRDILAGRLPGYMIPAYFVRLGSLPLTPGGKIHRKSLPVPEIRAGGDYVPPVTPLEKKLVKIWADVLTIEEEVIGNHANFFKLGGHSLTATSMVYRINREFDIDIELKDVFFAPTIKGLARKLEALVGSGMPGSIEIVPIEEREYYDLSYAQRRLWILCQIEEDYTAYNMPGAFVISGNLDIPAFQNAVQNLVDRHEGLRTVFIIVNGRPRQKISNLFELDLGPVDLRHLREDDRENRARELYRAYAHKVFNLERGPLFLFKLVRLTDEKYLFINNIHHIVSDGWSQAIVKREILASYHDISRGRSGLPGPLRFRYQDYAYWHNRLIDGFERLAVYWWEKFKDKPNGIELPLDHPRKPVQTFNGNRVKFSIDEEETSQFYALCLERDVTPFMGLLTVLDIFLYKYSGQRDIIVGLPTAGRKGDELQHIAGFLVNTLVFRIELVPGETAVQLLERVRQETLECYRNQDYPFDLLVDRLELDRDLSQSPLFNVMLAHNNLEARETEPAADHIEIGAYPYAHDVNMSKFDLLFFMDEVGEQIDVRLEYNSDLFDTVTVERMANNFFTLMGNVLHNPGKPICNLDCIESSEYRTIVQGFNDNEEEFSTLTVPELFEQQAEKTRDHVAAAADAAHITYLELNKKSNRLAHYLREEFSVTPGDIIGISMDRSLEMIVALLGIMKSGAAYMALDPAYPGKWLSSILADSQTKLVIVDQSRPELFSGYKGNVIDIGADWHAVALKSPGNPAAINRLADVLYVTYTSGSTGIPKGAAVSHHILTNLMQWQKKISGIDGSLRCLQFTSISFDVSFQEIMSTLTAGGGLVLIGEMERKDGDYLMNFLIIHGIEVLYLPFYYLNFLFTEGRWGESAGHCLKHIVTAGEQLIMTPGLKSFLQSNPRVRLHNHYGPAEMHVVTSFTLAASTAGDWHLPPIGRPISNIGIYILDEHDRPVPIGVWGEICIGGASSFAGYVNKPHVTAGKLVVNPAVAPDKKILYRTGDIGRWLADGNIELKGRKDFQVKIRGFRVEPGEIESKILSIDNIRDCVVVVKEDARHQDYLAAYIVVKDEIDVGEIRRLLSRDLPQYMIPRLTMLESLPLMPNGKVDRARLPEPAIDSDEQYAAPTNAIEKKLVELWSDVLGIEVHRIGIHDNFFQLGGHSLKATALAAKVHKAFNVKMPLTEIFKTSTVKEVSEYLKGAAAERFPVIEAVEARDYYPLSPAQKRLYYLQQIELQSINYNMPAALVLEGKLNKEKMGAAFEALICRHESLRTSFQMVGVEAVQRIHEGAEFEIEYSATEDTKKREIVRDSFIRPFDLSRGPLLRVGLVKENEDRHLLLVDMHHIISDGASLEVLVTDITALYAGGELLPLPLRYKDFSLWQDRFTRGKHLEQQETYWLQQFEDGVPLLSLPLDYERPAVKSSRGKVLEFETGEEAARALQELAGDEGATLFMVLVAIYNILLAKISNMEDIVIGTAAAGRGHPDLEPVIGMFVNTLVLRNFPSGRKTFREFLHQVKTRCLEAFSNQDYPFEDLVDNVTGSRETNRNPIFDVGFSLQNKSIISGDVPEVDGRVLGLTLKPYPLDAGISKFDLQLYAFETAANIRFNLEYSTDLFKHETIELMGRYFLNILGAVITNPGVSIKDIDIIGADQKKEILTQMKRKRGMRIEAADEDKEHVKKAGNKQADFDF